MSKKWALFGMGFVSSRHIKAIEDIGDKLVLTCDIDKSKQLPDYKFFTDWQEMINSHDFKDIDCVAIATPDYLHYPIIAECIRKKKRVLCEKPLTLRAEECDALPNNGKVGVILQLRNHPEVLKLKENYDGESGFTKVIVCREKRYWDSWQGKPEQCGGILNNIGVHYLDLILFVTGRDDYRVVEKHYSKDLAFGKIAVEGAEFDYFFEIKGNKEGQDRILNMGGKEISLSRQNNLAFEGWHTEVFRNFQEGKVILPSEAKRPLRLIEKLK